MDISTYFEWLDVLSEMAFSSAEPLVDRIEYGRWWVDCADSLQFNLPSST